MSCPDASPLAATLARLGAGEPWFSYVAGPPCGPGWTDVGHALVDPSVLDGWLADVVAGEARGQRDVASSYLAAWLGGALAAPLAAAVVSEGRGWPLVPDDLALRRHPEGWFDGLAVRAPTLLVLPDDPCAGRPDAEVLGDLDRLRRRVVADVVALLTPLFAALRARAPFGVRAMWSALADTVVARALGRARDEQGDAERAWHEANRLVDALAAAAPVPLTRPTRTVVAWSGGRAHFAVRGTCCLYYKVSGHEPDPCGEAFCTSCPLRDEDDRRRRWAAQLEEAHAERAPAP